MNKSINNLKSKLNINAIFFDLDDTLLNSKKAEFIALCEFKRKYKCFDKMDDNKLAKEWKEITLKQYDKYLKREISFEEQRINRMKEFFYNYSVVISDEEAKKLFINYLETYKNNWSLHDDALDVLNILKKNYKLVIVSNGDSIQQREKILKIGIEKYFTDIIISDEVGCSKPSKEIFDLASERIKIKKENIIMIGDRFKTDIEGALNAGLHAIWINRDDEKIEYKYTVKNLSEIIKYI